MIPVTLQLKNFLSYGALQTIHFGPYPLICLSGKNGHGKSALLDALTWAVWGQARKISGVAKSDMHLLRLGQTHMLVIFDFLFNDIQYRIRREYTKSYGKPQATLDFGFIHPDSQKMVSLSGKTIRDTQATIEKTIGLDFDSFCNSAFLRQGQSNEFSKKSPKERKDILCSILGLHQYEQLKKGALDKIKQANIQVQHYETVMRTLQEEINELPFIEEQLLCIQKNMQEVLQQGSMLTKKTQQAEEQKKQLLIQQQEYCTIREQITTYQEKITTAIRQIESLHKLWKECHKAKLTAPSLEHINKEQLQLLTVINEQQHILQKTLEVREKILHVQSQEQQEFHRIQEQYQEHKQRYLQEISLLSQQESHILTEQAKLSERSQTIQAAQKSAAQIEKQYYASLQAIVLPEGLIQKAQKKLDKALAYYHMWLSKQTMLQESSQQLTHKRTLTEQQHMPSCPLCEQNLSGARKKFLRSKFMQEEYRIAYRLNRLRTVLEIVQKTITDCRNRLTRYQQECHNYQQIQQLYNAAKTEHATYTQTLLSLEQETTALQEKLAKMRLSLQEAQDRLLLYAAQEETLRNTDQTYIQIHAQRKNLEQELSVLHYNKEHHRQACQALATLEQKKASLLKMQEQLAEQEQRKHRIFLLCKTLKADKQTLQQLQKKIMLYASLKDQEQIVQKQMQEIQQLQQSIQTNKEQILHKKGQLEHAHQKLQKYTQDCAQYHKKVTTLQQTIFEYQAIAAACSKDGIQALLIEDALPEIEQEANFLLEKLTDNQAHIFMESLRDLQKGGTKETLDINISDAQGIRPYELFSGGEAFRIDFALRIAISKLLARRSGTCLQTLIIDEGFGSQDEEGLAHIMDALHKIQDNFCKIIIVSHLHTVKDQFPVHFYIEKNSQGSTVKVIEQG